MVWVKVDDQLPELFAAHNLSASASWLWVEMTSYSCRHLTDGHVPRDVLRRISVLPRPTVQAAQLVAAGQLEVTETGWYVTNFAKYQPDAVSVLAKREKEKTKKQRRRVGGQPARGVPQGTPPGDSPGGVPRPPARPDPKGGFGAGGKDKQGALRARPSVAGAPSAAAPRAEEQEQQQLVFQRVPTPESGQELAQRYRDAYLSDDDHQGDDHQDGPAGLAEVGDDGAR